MTIKAKLLITTIIAVGLSLVISFFILFVNEALREIIEENQRTEEIARGVFELNTLTNDYILYRNQRSSDQWWLRYNSIARLLIEVEKSEHLEEQEIIGDLHKNHKSIATTFLQLVTVLGRKEARKDSVSQELEERLVGQLLIQSQAMVSGASMLAGQTRKELAGRQQQVSSFFMITIFIVILIVVASSLSTMRSVLKPFTELQQGAEIIGKGNLKHRIDIKSKDEIGQLAGAFNQMTAKLKGSYSSLKEKNKELATVLQRVIHEKDKINIILQSIADGVFVIDTSYKITIFNQAAADISGFDSREVIGKRYDNVLQFVLEKDEKVNDKFIIEAMRAGKTTEMSNHTVLIKKDGSRLPVADSAAPLKDKKGNVVGCVAIFRDVTREREMSKMQSEFISIASHQLRTPMTTIQWVIERFFKKEKLSKQGKEYLGDIRKTTYRLSNLTDLLLSVSRIEEGGVNVSSQPLELVGFIERYLDECTPDCDKKNITLIFKKHPKILNTVIDSGLLRNIVHSIVSNALDYNLKGGRVEVCLEKKERRFLFVVSDTGIGIPKEEQATILDKFTRGSNAKLINTNGTGLGLYLTKQAVELLNGKIWFESEKNKGTTFYVELPIKLRSKIRSKTLV